MSSDNKQGSAAIEPAGVPLEERPGLEAVASELVERARSEGVSLTGDGGLLPALVARVLETGLQAELTEHLGYETHAVEGRGSGNSRNGSFPKTVTTEIGRVDLRVPRDRNGTFEPKLVPHGQRRLDGVEAQVISLYASGLTTGEIQGRLAEIYGTSVSRGHGLADHGPDRVGYGDLAVPTTRPGLRGRAH